jgi:hypothetical protein
MKIIVEIWLKTTCNQKLASKNAKKLSNAICWNEDEAHIWKSKSDLLLWIDWQLIKSYYGLMASVSTSTL